MNPITDLDRIEALTTELINRIDQHPCEPQACQCVHRSLEHEAAAATAAQLWPAI